MMNSKKKKIIPRMTISLINLNNRVDFFRKNLKHFNKVYCFQCKKWRLKHIYNCINKKCEDCGNEILIKSDNCKLI